MIAQGDGTLTVSNPALVVTAADTVIFFYQRMTDVDHYDLETVTLVGDQLIDLHKLSNGSPAPAHGQPLAVRDSQGDIHLTWKGNVPQGIKTHYRRRSQGYWQPLEIMNHQGGCGSPIIDLAAGNQPYIAFTAYEKIGGQWTIPGVFVGTPNGGSWQKVSDPPTIIEADHEPYSDMAINALGDMCITWIDNDQIHYKAGPIGNLGVEEKPYGGSEQSEVSVGALNDRFVLVWKDGSNDFHYTMLKK